MNSMHEVLKKVCDRLDIPCEDVRGDGISLRVDIDGKYYYSIHNGLFFNHSYIKTICDDKEFAYSIFDNVIDYPRYKHYLNYRRCFDKEYSVEFKTNGEIVEDICSTFDFPLIVKMNKGSFGRNVFKCKNKEEVDAAVDTIFSNYSSKDYLLIAQEGVDIKEEFRIITYNGKLEFAYKKDITGAQYVGNLSPLHWEGSKAVLVEDRELLTKLDKFVSPIHRIIPATILGIDVVIDKNDRMWLLEVNSNPVFLQFLNHCESQPLEILFEKLMMDIKKREVYQTTPPIN